MLSCKQAKFSLPGNYTYLNCAYMSPMMKSVERAGIRGLRTKRNPALISPQVFFEDSGLLRSEFAKLIGAVDPSRVAIIPSVSYGIASVARNIAIGRAQNVIVATEQFPSNYYSWQRLCLEAGAELRSISPGEGLAGRGKRWNERILDAINANTKVVAIAHTHWSDGTRFDLQAIRKRTREVNALLVVDGSQSVGALSFDINTIQPDALVCAGYKWLLGPYGIGLAYYGEYFDNGKPIEESWINRLKSEDFSALVSYNPEYQPGALRYEVGEHSNFILVPMMLKALQQINRWGVNNIQEYCTSVSRAAVDSLRGKGYWVEDEAQRGGHIMGIRLPAEIAIEKVKSALLKNRINVSYRGSAIRVSPNVYNRESDLQKLVRALTRL